MNEFVEECRREWRRLGVPDPIANEMAADLTADIEEAEAEGGSAEDVLGNSVFDARRFAASWAGARGVTAPVPPDGPPNRPRHTPDVPGDRPSLPSLPSSLLAAVALLLGRRSASAAVSVRRILGAPGPGRLLRPWSGRPAVPIHRVRITVCGTEIGRSSSLRCCSSSCAVCASVSPSCTGPPGLTAGSNR